LFEMSTTGALIRSFPLSNSNNPDYLAVVTPEPAMPALLGVAVLGLLARRRRV
jgi:hypothetical protein